MENRVSDSSGLRIPRRSRRRGIAEKTCNFVVVGLFLIGLVVGVYRCLVPPWPPTCGNTPKEIFEGVIREGIPTGVRELQGVGDMWQSYNVWLRFQAPDTFIDGL